MQINCNQNFTPNITPNFKAVRVAKTQNYLHGIKTDIDIYKLTNDDKCFLQEWGKKVDFKKLCPKLSTLMQERWQKVFSYCINMAQGKFNTTYVAVSESRPCGILTFMPDNTFLLDGICAVPDETGYKANLVGKTLFYQIFKDAQEFNAKNIALKAINDGPFDVVDKYEKLGFKKEQGSNDEYTKMSCNKYQIATQLEELPLVIDYIETEPENFNLKDLID